MPELLASFTYEPMQRWGPVSPHGIGTALGFFLGAWLMARRADPDIPKPEVYNAVTWGAVGAIIGARGFYVIGHLDQFDSARDMLAVWEGGLTMFGGFIGGLALGLGYLRRKGFPIPFALDAAAPGFVVGVIVGRLGDIAIADHLGRPTDFALGYEIPNAPLAPGYGPPTYAPGAVVHHTAVYDLAGALVLLGFLYWLGRRKPRTGTLFAAFSIWYGLQRVAVDFTRNREAIESVFLGLSGSQWAGIAFAVGGAIGLYRISRASPLAAGGAPAEPQPAPVGSVPPAGSLGAEAEPSPEPESVSEPVAEPPAAPPAREEPPAPPEPEEPPPVPNA